ncbi:hypothetical protein AMECASPLE_018502 [Ameca splendens]|uniref:Uncharacterized protein n=1 Tax=Ameca splendens TaxID=208324 RepID=A0ABV0ZDE8_9TELE
MVGEAAFFMATQANQYKMPPFSIDDYLKPLQKILVMEIKILQLEVNVKVNAGYRNQLTLPMIIHSNRTDRHLTSTTNKQITGVNDCAPTSSPPWNSLGTKLKDKSLP